MERLEQYISLTPKKRYRKGVRLQVNAYSMAVLCVVFVSIYMMVFKQHLHPYMQIPALLLVVGIGASVLMPSTTNKGKKLCEQFLILFLYVSRKLFEKVVRYVSI